MNIKIINNIPGLKVKTDSGDKETIIVTISSEGCKTLGEHLPGDIITLGSREYIVLGHEGGGTALLTKFLVKKMPFGKTSDYLTSDVRKFCNKDFYKELADIIGEENILTHSVNLTADDGTGKDSCDDDVSLLTTERYRLYREVIPAYGEPWYTATRANADNKDYTRSVCCVYSSGVLCWRDVDCDCGVRPFCILNSSLCV